MKKKSYNRCRCRNRYPTCILSVLDLILNQCARDKDSRKGIVTAFIKSGSSRCLASS
ncbi:MAG TPA: hypothetical protein VKY57_11255 [Chitinispirillaceae bacterium]|nr:hypothetical protein [Chitinispirillaceae bacterium]